MEVFSLTPKDKFVVPLMDNGVSKVVQFTFEKGKVLQQHRTSSDILVQVISGKVVFKAFEGETKEVTLQPGQLLSLEPTIEHEVEALADSVMILTLTPSPSMHTILKPDQGAE